MLPLKNELRSKISVIILCAGEGTRFKEITKNLPKPLLKIKSLNNTTILHHTINNFIKLGINQIAVIKGHLGYQIDEFISSLQKIKKDLTDKLLIIDSGFDYKLGPLYSFLSMTKNNMIFKKDNLFLVIPGDTIFEFNLLNDIIITLMNNSNLIQEYPILFYRKIKVSNLKEKHNNVIQNSPKFISIVQIESKNSKTFLKAIQQEDLRVVQDLEIIKQVIPIFLFNFKIVNKFLKLKEKISANTIREIITYMINNGEKIIAIEIDNRFEFYDIDSKLDLYNYNLKKKKMDNRNSDFTQICSK
ncbi:MAG: sugar phosphate nucleotidyltransferase [Promethearchaeota archaeon]